MVRPYNVGPGWWRMLDEQLSKARAVAPDVTHKEKEKYGRCNIDFWSEELYGSSEELFAIEMEIERRSLQICEFCGRPGRLREDQSWMQTLCDRCADLDPLERRKIAQETEAQYFRRDRSVLIAPGLKLYCTPSGWYAFDWDWNEELQPDMLGAIIHLQTIVRYGDWPPATGPRRYHEDSYRSVEEAYEDMCLHALAFQEIVKRREPPFAVGHEKEGWG